MHLAGITPLVLTYNEEANVARTLGGLLWARRVVVVDSGSTDGTLDILAEHPKVEVYHREFDDFASQCNFGLQFVDTPWVLSIDADYCCPPELKDELLGLSDAVDGYEALFVYCIHGRRLRSSLYPPRIVLFRTDKGGYLADGHAHRLQIDGKIGRLNSRILHDDRKPLGRWLAEQTRYAELEVEKLVSTPWHRLGWKDRLRTRIVWAAPLTLFYCLFWKRLIFDGWPGVYYTLQRGYAELLLSLKLLDARLRGSATLAF